MNAPPSIRIPRTRCAPAVCAALPILLFLALAPAARPSATKSPSSGEAPPRLRVVLAEPVGEQTEVFEMSASFDAPMVRLGERGRTERKGPIRFDPPLRGTFTWLGTSTVSFQPEAPPAPGSRITCTIPSGTRSIGGARLAEDHVWTIEYRRPRLLAAVPRVVAPAKRSPATEEEPALPRSSGPHPLDDPFLFAFDRPPEPDAWKRIRISGPEGDLPLQPIPVTAEHMEALFGSATDGRHDGEVIALRAPGPLREESLYIVTVPADLRFTGAELDLGASVTYPFRSLGPLRVEGIKARDGELAIRFSSPIEAETLLAHVVLDPRPARLRVRGGWSGETEATLSGAFPPGKPVQVKIPPGMPDLFGRTLAQGFSQRVEMPHASPLLRIFPGSGVLMPDPHPEVQIHARNVTELVARGAWILDSEMPQYYGARSAGARSRDGAAATRRTPWEARSFDLPAWNAAAVHDDSLCVLRRELASLGPPPPGARALLLTVRALRRFPRAAREAPDDGYDGESEGYEDTGTYGARPDTFRTGTLVRVSPIGISSVLGEESGLLWVTDLKTGRPVAGAAVSLWPEADSAGKAPLALWRGRTDADGLAATPGRHLLAPRGVPRLARAETPLGVSWLELTVPWRPAPLGFDAPNAAFLFTDRPIYRPGETVRWKAYVRDADVAGLNAVRPFPVRARLRVREQEQATDHILQGSGNADGSFLIPADCPSGYHNVDLVQVLPDGRTRALASASVQVEEFRAPRFEAHVETATPRILSGGSATVSARFAYFAGGPLAKAPVAWYLSRQPMHFLPQGWEEYAFRDQLASWKPGGFDWMGPMVVQQGEALLDLDGRARLEIPIALPPEAGDSRVIVEVGARDLSDQSASDRTVLEVVRGPLRPGVASTWDEPADRGHGVWRWVVVDTGGVIAPGVPVTLELWRREWKTVRIRRLGGTFDYENTPRDTLLARSAEASGAAARLADYAIPGAGLYYVRVALAGPNDTTLAASDSRWFGGEETASFPRETVQWIELQPDRATVLPEDTLRVVIPTPTGGAQGLVLLQSGGLLRAERVELRGTPAVDVPIGAIAPPDVTVSAILVAPDRVPADDRGGPRQFLPYFAHGSCSVAVDDGAWRAKVEVIPAAETAEPGSELSVEIRLSDPAGRPLAGEVTLAVVDEAVLALAAEPDPDPLHRLFTRRGTDTEYDDTRYLLRLMPLEEKGESSPGGGGAEAAAMGRLRARFDVTAYWNPSIRVGPEGSARISFRLPDALTRYRLRAVASAEGELFGVGDARVRVDRSLSVEAAAPRFARAGDRWTLGALVQNRTREPIEVRVTCALRGGRVEGDTAWTGTVEAGRTRRADFPVRTPDPGRLEYTLRAAPAGAGGAAADAVRRSLPVHFATERVTEVTSGRAAPRAEEGVDLADPGFAGSGKLTASLSPTLLSDLGDAVDYLIDFPHACIEQIDSRLLGLLARRELSDRLPPDTLSAEAIDRRIAAGLQELEARRDMSTFRIWPESRGGHPYLDAYTLYTLARLRQAGIRIPSELWDGALTIARRHGRLNDGTPDVRIPPDLRALLLWARLEARDPGLLDVEMEQAVQEFADLGTSGQIALLLALDRFADARPGQPFLRQTTDSRIEKTLQALSGRIDRTARSAWLGESAVSDLRRWSSGAQDRVRSTALTVMLLSRHDPNHPLLPPLATGLIEGRRHGRWANTHENALALEAVREYAARAEALRLPAQGRLVLGVNRTEGVRFEAGDLRPRRFDYSLRDLLAIRRPDPATKHLPLTFEGDGRAPLFYQVRLDRFVSGLEAGPSENGLVVFREYLDAATGERIETLVRGRPILAHLALVVPRDADFLLVEDPLPAGVEAVNLRLRTSSRLAHRAGAAERRASESAGSGAVPHRVGGAPPWRSSSPGGEEGARLHVRHRDLRDDRARFYADEVPAGVYHIVYPVAATTPGTFGTPGARAELLYDAEVYGTSGAEEVKVE